MNNFEKNKELVEKMKARLEYIRSRLLIMALLPNFEELVEMKVHLYMESSFNEVVYKALKIPKRKFCNYTKIAKVAIKMYESTGEDKAFFESLVNEYLEELEIDFNILPQNKGLLNKLLVEFAG